MESQESKIWKRLIDAGFTPAGAAGMMGNLYAESALNPKNLQNSFEKSFGYTDDTYTAAVDSGAYSGFVRDSAGYGLAQWTFWTRKEALLEYARRSGRSIGDLDMQLDFLLLELYGSYPAVVSVLESASSIRAASDAVLLDFERPADKSESQRAKRASYAQTYYDKYAKKGDIDVSKEELRTFVREAIAEYIDELNPVYADLKDVPAYWQDSAKALLDSGAVNGGTPASVNATDINLRHETLKAAIIAIRACDARHQG